VSCSCAGMEIALLYHYEERSPGAVKTEVKRSVSAISISTSKALS
jgi:hypothetical protein